MFYFSRNMLNKYSWSDIKVVGFGGMLVECLVAIMALIAATALQPADYFAINSTPEVFETLGMNVVHLPELSEEIGLDLEGRTGGAVTLAVGMTYIFTEIPIFKNLASYFFQFVGKLRRLLEVKNVYLNPEAAGYSVLNAMRHFP
jgi:carbon starvation protein